MATPRGEKITSRRHKQSPLAPIWQETLIRLCTFENNAFEIIKNISQEAYDGLKDDSDYLKNTYKQFVVFKYLQLNLKDYFEFIEKLTKVPTANIDYNIVTNQSAVLEANKLILNVLTSFKFFLDNAETYLKRTFGKESQIVKDYVLLTNENYDSSFAYRFLSKMRNYSIHLGFPLEALNLDIDFNNENPEKSFCDFELKIDIDKLKNEKSLFGSLHKELIEMDDDIDLRPLITELSHYIMETQKFLNKKQRNEIEEAIYNIEKFVGNHKTDKNQIKVYSNFDDTNGKISFNVYEVSFDIIKEYKLTYKNWC